MEIIQRKEKQRQKVYASNETVLTRSGGTCLCCYPHYEPRRRRTLEQGFVKPLVKLVWLWEVSTVLRSKDTSRVFCPSTPGTGRRRRLLVWWCGVRSCSWGKAGWSCSWEATLKGLLLLAPGDCALARCHCPGGKGPVISTNFQGWWVWGAGPSYGAFENENATSWEKWSPRNSRAVCHPFPSHAFGTEMQVWGGELFMQGPTRGIKSRQVYTNIKGKSKESSGRRNAGL